MKILPILFNVVLILAVANSAVVAAPAARQSPPAAPVPAQPAAPAPEDATPLPQEAVPVPTLKFDDYIADLTATLKLSDDEKTSIVSFYVTDGPLMKNVLNNDALQPVEKAQQVADMRAARNTKIETVLHDADRQRAFREIEARYRVALTLLAAQQGLVCAAQ